MSKRAAHSLRHYLGQVSDQTAPKADAHLLRQFIDANDHQAFEILLKRHGPMVLGTARRLVNNAADAADVFQAVFLSLARLAKRLRGRQAVANWLYTTTCRVAARARKRRAVSIENAPEPSTATTAETDLVWREVRTALDEELQRLPERLRSPLLLCYLSGLTRDEAAEQLGWSISTLKRRLEEARTALRKGLERRGISTAGLALAVLSPSALDAAVCPALAKSCLDAVLGKEVADNVSALGLTTTTTKGIAMKAIIVSLALIGLGVGIYPSSGRAGGQFSTANAARLEVQPAVLFPLMEWTSAPAARPEPLALKGHTSEVWTVCYSPDGKRIVTGGGDLPRGIGGGGGGNPPGPGEVKVWDAAKGTEILALKGHTTRVQSVCFSPDGKRVASAGMDQTVRVWDAEKGEEIFTLKGQTRGAGSVCFSPDGKRIACIGSEHLKVWDSEKGQELLTLATTGRPNGSVCFSPDGKRIASLYPWNLKGRLVPGEVKVWDVEKGQELLSLKGHKDFVLSVCFSPDGKRIATAGGDQTVRVWDAEKGAELLVIDGHTEPVSSVCFSPDGKRIATAGWDKTVKVWDAEKGKELLTLDGHTSLVRSVCFSPDGKRIASASKDQTVKVWSLDREK
jgi:RNA polymerase sigma factor (sigma-70 family)